MKTIFTFLFIIYSLGASAQKTHTEKSEQLYYFLTPDSLLGVKNQFNKIIIQPRRDYGSYDSAFFATPIDGEIIFMEASDDERSEPHSLGAVYNRKGELLFNPLAFDNGPDRFTEGLMRFVKNKKIGFANRAGQVVIDAKFDFADPFRHGVAQYCNGCVWQTRGERQFVTGGVKGFINVKGEILATSAVANLTFDQLVDSGVYVKDQFNYTQEEKKLLGKFYNEPLIARIQFVNYYSKLDSLEMKLRYEITERPSAFFPWIQVTGYQYLSHFGYYQAHDLEFLIDPTTGEIFNMDYFGEKRPYKEWLAESVKKAKEYSEEHKDVPYRFVE